MLVNCTSVFLCFSLLFLTFFIRASRRQNVIFLISLCSGMAFVIFFCIIEWFFPIEASFFENIAHFFDYIPGHPQGEERRAFAYGLLLIGIFLTSFILGEIILNIFYPKAQYLKKRDRYYYLTKSIFIFGNTLIVLFVLMFIITDLNIVYHIPEGGIYPLMDLFFRGLLNL